MRRPSATWTCRSSRGSYQIGGVVMVSPAKERRMRSSTPFLAAISSSSTLYPGGGSEPKSSRKARLVRRLWPSARQKPGGLRQQKFSTTSGIDLAALYGPESAPSEAYEERLGFPGQFPFTRGVQPTMYRGRFWTMRQYAGFGTADQTNARFHFLLKGGQTGLSTAFDLPTQAGHDSDSPRARGEGGRVGAAIDTVEDMERLFKGIPLGKVSTSMTINATASTLLALYQAVAEAQ